MEEHPRRPAPINGTEQRLDDLIAELRGLRAELATTRKSTEAPDGTIELREPKRGNR